MKAVKQIIHHLRGRGLLSRQDLIALANEGFLTWSEVGLEEDEESGEPAAVAIEPRPVLKDPAVPTSFPRRRKPAGRRSLPRSPREADTLAGRLAARFYSWSMPLEGLLQVGGRLGDCRDWVDAALVIRQAEFRDLCRALARGLKERSPLLGSLWNAITLDEYRSVMAEEGVNRQAASSFRALLASRSHAEVGKHGWLLKKSAVAQVHNLKLAQKRLLQACEQVRQHRPELLAACLRRHDHAGVYWSCVLVYSSLRSVSASPSLPDESEHRPPRRPLSYPEWLEAWCHAAGMAPRSVPALLLEQQRHERQRPTVLADVIAAVLQQLKPGERGVVLDYYQGRSESTVAQARALTLDEVHERLERVRQALHAALGRTPGIQGHFLAEPPRIRAMIVEDCLCEGTKDVTPVIERYFSATAGLLCPRRWDV